MPQSVPQTNLVSVVVVLKGTFLGETHVLGLSIAHGAEMSIDVLQVEERDLLVENLGKSVDANVKLAGSAEFDVFLAKRLVLGLEQHDLGQDLVGEGAGHDE